MSEAVADINEVTERFNRLLFLTNSYVVPLSDPPKRRSFNSDTEISDIILEADEKLMLSVRNTPGHPWASNFYALSAALVDGDAIPGSSVPIQKVTWCATSNGTYTNAEVADIADIIEANRDYTLFGAAVTDIYGYYNVLNNILYSTSPYVKVTQAPWTRTAACQSPKSYTWGVIATAIMLAPKEGLNTDLLDRATQSSMSYEQAIRGGSMMLPPIAGFEAQEAAP